jgi:hypothetical protein
MELYELGMAPSVLLIAAVMDLLDVNSSHARSRACPPCPAGPSPPGGSPHQGPTREVARARSASPEPTTDALAARPWIRNGEPPCRPRWSPAAAPRPAGSSKADRRPGAHWSAQAGPASYAIGALCSTGAAIPLAAIGLLAA